ncbi:uncharacterized protein LOC114351573 isoform X1 [Ostrinia furnacalis]|uniref:uncharacterized protein LOC114351573 isoform X1 n=1 Tax=Ostrinia furnacalis TaxID=93504 RepID=UPI00103DB834|nr:uncharacterized protein LOC114351573 isoform X1 [Ostrinia furnacalis]XP_028158636.1 uncharacterized protein LOC114351573 isoform X1 [Ostrinia furnacalis]XP_028158638.1 uncharacterized protein LOC114351573 isoform X1 [Ostrinia furnacalis]XP_028158639.1 uncharacterized protein LOC114351573 isoform X1 [Ostrinia furnacalis]XP_028158640.1 uncharacterized protein LOC114351573 isoform X1 [Ostrinia furnacalis]
MRTIIHLNNATDLQDFELHHLENKTRFSTANKSLKVRYWHEVNISNVRTTIHLNNVSVSQDFERHRFENKTRFATASKSRYVRDWYEVNISNVRTIIDCNILSDLQDFGRHHLENKTRFPTDNKCRKVRLNNVLDSQEFERHRFENKARFATASKSRYVRDWKEGNLSANVRRANVILRTIFIYVYLSVSSVVSLGVDNAVVYTSHSSNLSTILSAVILTDAMTDAWKRRVSIVLTFLTLTHVSANLTVFGALILTLSMTDTNASLTEARSVVTLTAIKMTDVTLTAVKMADVTLTAVILAVSSALAVSILFIATLSVIVFHAASHAARVLFEALNVYVRMTDDGSVDGVSTVKMGVFSVCVFQLYNGRAFIICVCVRIGARDSYVFYPLYAVSDFYPPPEGGLCFFVWKFVLMDFKFRFDYLNVFIIIDKLSDIKMAASVCVSLDELVCVYKSMSDAILNLKAYCRFGDFSLVLSVIPVIFYCYYNFIIDNVIPNIVLLFLNWSVILMPFFIVCYPVSGFYPTAKGGLCFLVYSLGSNFINVVGVVFETDSLELL